MTGVERLDKVRSTTVLTSVSRNAHTHSTWSTTTLSWSHAPKHTLHMPVPTYLVEIICA